jgi:cysteinyl-tRNA synthetase
VAQNTAHHGSGGPRYWMHANMLTLNGKRMSKSTGNTLLPMELFTGFNDILSKGFAPSVVRFFILQAHYRSTLDFSNDALVAAEKGYQRLMEAWKTLKGLAPTGATGTSVQAWKDSCYAAMDDDFNSPILISKLFDMVPRINAAAEGKEGFAAADLDLLRSTFQAMLFDVLGLEEPRGGDAAHVTDALVQLIIELRNEARKGKDFATSDRLRDALAKAGVILKDGKEGTTYTVQ